MVAVSFPSEIPGGSFAPKRAVSLADGERWYAVHTLPFAERRAAAQLENHEFCTFLPQRQKTVRHARKLRTIKAPFFPRYLFVALDLARHQWRSVNGTFGVSSLVMVGERPCPAPCGIVESLMSVADVDGVLQLHSDLKIGEPVRLAAGPFADQLGVLDRLDGAGRVRVLLSMFCQQVPVCLSRTHVLPVG
jgi:transcription elongation factor/antiterminator RfaH